MNNIAKIIDRILFFVMIILIVQLHWKIALVVFVIWTIYRKFPIAIHNQTAVQTNTSLNHLDVSAGYTNNVFDFWRAAYLPKYRKQAGTVILPPRTDGRVHGALMFITPRMLTQHKQWIQSGAVSRDDEARRMADVPGFDLVKHEFVEANGQSHAMWHRTHLLPFRFTLSEGQNIDGLMIAGTAHLNHGDRPQLGYIISDSAPINQTFINNYKARDKAKIRQINTSFGPKGTHFSLDAVESLASYLIQWDTSYSNAWVENPNLKDVLYKYAVICNYKDNGPVPDSVTVTLSRAGDGHKLLDVTLPNVF